MRLRRGPASARDNMTGDIWTMNEEVTFHHGWRLRHGGDFNQSIYEIQIDPVDWETIFSWALSDDREAAMQAFAKAIIDTKPFKKPKEIS